MQELDINGITVKYPFIPYDVQKHYMQSVIRSLDSGENALLESPTGTGKTLCLLCSTLGWIEHRKKQMKNTNESCINDSIPNANTNSNGKQNSFRAKTNDIPLVIYASRTHSQLLQAMKELKRSAYGYMKAGVVASRDQLCLNPELKMENNSNKILKCKKLISEDCCDYLKNVDASLTKPEFSENPVLDIEDLVRHGKNFECCPYYVAKHLATNADILFMPYNYLLDPKIREINQSNLRNAIIILDEAHNVPKTCEDSACSRITSTEIFIALREIRFILKSLPNELSKEKQISIDEVARLSDKLVKLSNEMLNIKIANEIRKDSYPGGYIFELFNKAEINEGAIETLQKLFSYLVEYSKGFKKSPKGMGLQALLDFLQIAYSSSAPDLRDRVNRAYKVHLQSEPEKKKNVNETKRKREKNSKYKIEREEEYENRKIINFWCFSAEFGMNYLQRQNIHCVILTSGTLTPLDSLINELQIPIPIELSNKHVINNQQIFGRIIKNGPDKKLLDSRFKNRDTKEYMLSLGKTILEFSKVVPEGLLVFFAAYSVMDKCIEFWETNGIYHAINNEKNIFIEPRKKDELKKTMNDYYVKINEENSKGAIFMAVLRAKVSEGLDFADMYGRGVIITGLPFGPIKDPKIILKKEYLNENRTPENRMLSGWEWYALDAVRAVNQAIGRVIRHRNDYGAILLCDVRFLGNQRNISSWIRNELSDQQIGTIINDLGQFYENARQSLPEPSRIIPDIDSSEDEEDLNDTFGRYESSDYYTSSESDNDDEEDSESRSTSPKPSTCAAGRINNGSQVTIHKKKPRLSDQNGSNGYSSEVVNESVKLHPIPINMEYHLGIERYQELVQTWFKYDADGDYELYRDSLFSIFNDEKWIYVLKGCLLFTKLEHQASLDKDIAAFIQGLQ